ncbi:MAG: hypothetical protein IPH20_19165 [Bacteroidales bacterium]|nr:hypothetical protein [Bacteroidales bacterium]
MFQPNPITVISGDIGFLYDSNALWNVNLKPVFRIAVINNGGGNIFRISKGLPILEQLEFISKRSINSTFREWLQILVLTISGH